MTILHNTPRCTVLATLLVVVADLTVANTSIPDSRHMAADAAIYSLFKTCLHSTTGAAQRLCGAEYAQRMAKFEDNHQRKISK